MQSLENFYPNGDTTTLASRWKTWKRAFNIYLISKGVTQDGQKLALLLHTGGFGFSAFLLYSCF